MDVYVYNCEEERLMLRPQTIVAMSTGC